MTLPDNNLDFHNGLTGWQFDVAGSDVARLNADKAQGQGRQDQPWAATVIGVLATAQYGEGAAMTPISGSSVKAEVSNNPLWVEGRYTLTLAAGDYSFTPYIRPDCYLRGDNAKVYPVPPNVDPARSPDWPLCSEIAFDVSQAAIHLPSFNGGRSLAWYDAGAYPPGKWATPSEPLHLDADTVVTVRLAFRGRWGFPNNGAIFGGVKLVEVTQPAPPAPTPPPDAVPPSAVVIIDPAGSVQTVPNLTNAAVLGLLNDQLAETLQWVAAGQAHIGALQAAIKTLTTP